MTLVPLNIPPGIKRAGTLYQSRGRYYDSHLVRFFSGAVGPVGGWVNVKDTAQENIDVTGVPRAMLAWRSNDSRIWLAIGTHSKIYAYNNGVLTDITPLSSFTPGDQTSTGTGSKYGRGLYGRGLYGRGGLREGSGGGPLETTESATWQLDTFGEYLIGVLSADAKIRYWDLDVDNDMTVVSADAPDALGVVTTQERFLFALGAARKAEGVLSFTGQPANGETVTIGTKVYTFQTVLTNVDGNVDIGASTNDSIDALVAAINLDAGAGTLYASATTQHPTVSAVRSGSTLVVTALTGGTTGNATATTTNIANATWGDSTMTGGYGSIRTIAWADQESFEDWTPVETNSAGDYELKTEGRLMAGRRLPRETLLWTDADLYTAIYIGGDFVYTFERRGDRCGLIAPNAVALSGDSALWMGNNGFFRYAGGVTPLECEVQDYVFGRLNRSQARKVWAWSNSQYNEIWWFYPSNAGDEIDSCVVYNYVENTWTLGSLVRTAGVDRDPFSFPIMAGVDGFIFEHERGSVRSGTDLPYLESGPIDMMDGDNVIMIRRILPDERALGELELVLFASYNPTDAETQSDVITLTAPTAVRLTGRQIRFRFQESEESSDWRLGVPRFEVVARGKR